MLFPPLLFFLNFILFFPITIYPLYALFHHRPSPHTPNTPAVATLFFVVFRNFLTLRLCFQVISLFDPQKHSVGIILISQ